MIIIEEKNDIEDALVGLFYQSQHSKIYKKKLLRNQLMVPAIWLSLASYLIYVNNGSNLIPLWIPISMIIFSIIWLMFYHYRFKKINKKYYRNYLENKQKELGDFYTNTNTFELSKEQITIKSNRAINSFEPSRIEKTVELTTHLVIYVKSAGSISINKRSKNYYKFKKYFDSLDVVKMKDDKWKF